MVEARMAFAHPPGLSSPGRFSGIKCYSIDAGEGLAAALMYCDVDFLPLILMRDRRMLGDSFLGGLDDFDIAVMLQ